ncbi:MAG TPA: tRNA pseudouridine(13) synthase TruD [Methanoregula sp.]|nr:tRNA pseudouridine(13) synthase TruD [Methanoregula sp.]
MRPSPWPLERELGMRWYASDEDGIGGSLRTSPGDFVVEEIPLPAKGGSEGPYLICLLTKKNWELQHAVKEIAKRLGVSHRRIGWAGTKDRNAVTRQWISLYNITPGQVAEIRLKDITLEPVKQANEALSLGDLAGNRFAIAIRNCTAAGTADLAMQVAGIDRAVSAGVPNYFGIQRFGAIRPVTHVVGEGILRGDYERAVATYIGKEFPLEAEHVKEARKAWLESRDAKEALRTLPVQMGYERAMLSYLATHDGDYAGALLELPPRLLSMFISAFQSYIFNCALSRRFEDGHSLTVPVEGDRLLFANGRTDTATKENAHAVSLHIARGRCGIALFMPGRAPFSPTSHGERATGALLAEYGIAPADFAAASAFVKTKFDGAWRPISLATAIESKVEGNDVALSFTLPPGHYATTVCREFMKADPVRMV